MLNDDIISQRYKKRNYPRAMYHPQTGRKVNPQYVRFVFDEDAPTHNRFMQRETDYVNTVEIEFQGEVIQAKCHKVSDRSQMGSGRRAITCFSSRARKNMLDTVGRLDWTVPATFITLTYHDNMMDAKKAKRDLRAVQKRWYRRYGLLPILWKMEPQKRGAWHFHLIAWNMPYISLETVMMDWQSVTGDDTITQVKIEPIRTAKKARSYTAKYCAKPIATNWANVILAALMGLSGWVIVAITLDYVPNLAVLQKPGRFWGIENRKNLVWAVLKTVSVVLDSAFHDFKRAARRKWAGINTTGRAGFTLYAENPDRWIDYLFYLSGKNYQPI